MYLRITLTLLFKGAFLSFLERTFPCSIPLSEQDSTELPESERAKLDRAFNRQHNTNVLSPDDFSEDESILSHQPLVKEKQSGKEVEGAPLMS